VNETEAIIKFIARMNPSTGLLGSSPFEEASVSQWMSWCQSTWLSKVHPPLLQLFGYTKQVDGKKFNEGVKEMKETAKVLDKHLNGKKWLSGAKMTLADLYVGACFASSFQTVLDADFKKSCPSITAWFQRFIGESAVVKRMGNIKLCSKALKPAGCEDDEPIPTQTTADDDLDLFGDDDGDAEAAKKIA